MDPVMAAACACAGVGARLSFILTRRPHVMSWPESLEFRLFVLLRAPEVALIMDVVKIHVKLLACDSGQNVGKVADHTWTKVSKKALRSTLIANRRLIQTSSCTLSFQATSEDAVTRCPQIRLLSHLY